LELSHQAGLGIPEIGSSDALALAEGKRILREFVESWSSPNDEALARLKWFYHKEDDFHGERDVPFDRVYQAKKQLAERFPERHLRIVQGTERVSEISPIVAVGYNVTARVEWTLRGAAAGADASGVSEILLRIPAHLSSQILAENERVLSTTSRGVGALVLKDNYVEFTPEMDFGLMANTDFLGEDFANKKGVSLSECQELCKQEMNCQSFTYVQRNRWCWLKSGSPGDVKKQGVIIGMKRVTRY
jgi:hypothetical protein